MSSSEGGRPVDLVDGGGAGGQGAGGGPRSTESREENEGKLWSGGGRKKRSTSLSGGDALCRQETLSLILGPLSADRAGEEAPARRVVERPGGRTQGVIVPIFQG